MHISPSTDTPSILTVTALNQAVARLLERSFPLTWIAGEVSNFTRASSGHWYFTLKDDGAQVRAVMFRGRAQHADFLPREGDKVEVRALVTLYGARGDYQINVEAIRRAGIGVLYEAFLRLKEKLGAQGWFDPERKRAIPMFARTVGIVTSLQAAALRDILTALARRAPHVSVIIYPTPVQGQQAPERIAAAINLASRRAECDVLLVCRGGGSMEDLMSFNDEQVAHAITHCSMPVIAGVGHETDFTIADFCADLRAATPTAAAEMAVTPRADWQASLKADAFDLRRAMRRTLTGAMQDLDRQAQRLQSPLQQIGHQRLKLLALSTAMAHANRAPLQRARFALERCAARHTAWRPDIAPLRTRLHALAQRSAISIRSGAREQRATLDGLTAQLALLNPQRTLERGYAIVTDAKGAIVRAPSQLMPRQRITLRLAEGSADVTVAEVQALVPLA
jgi:exodeoxyribonuclease VII large subunit